MFVAMSGKSLSSSSDLFGNITHATVQVSVGQMLVPVNIKCDTKQSCIIPVQMFVILFVFVIVTFLTHTGVQTLLLLWMVAVWFGVKV